MTTLETVLVFAGGPLAILGVLALLTLRPTSARAPRYRPGQGWDHPPVWWTADPDAVGATRSPAGLETTAHTARGGARGTW
ncbi:MAG: hypothetical protein GEV09_19545 [Pseudonocardiaceae bacterium]|nr:hypothetical protein [Pseudonocardiaceae bacterium]